MQIRVNTDSSVEAGPDLSARIEAEVQSALQRFEDQITTVIVHLSDENRTKGGANDKRCAIEGRLRGLQPLATTHQAASFEQAAVGAAEKLRRAIENAIGRLRDR